jgi:hypothetical protein
MIPNTSGELIGMASDLEVIAPVFLLIGSAFIAGYLAPIFMGKIDALKSKEIEA